MTQPWEQVKNETASCIHGKNPSFELNVLSRCFSIIIIELFYQIEQFNIHISKLIFLSIYVYIYIYINLAKIIQFYLKRHNVFFCVIY